MRSERLLVSMKDYIGDAVMTEPMLAAVEKLFARVELNAGSPVDQVLWRPGEQRKFIQTPRPKRAWEAVRQARSLREKSYDAVILVNRSFRSALTVRLAGIPCRIGHNTEGRGAFLTQAVPYDRARFEVLSQFDLATLAGVEEQPRMPTLVVTDDERKHGLELAQGATVGLQPGARWPGKRLPEEVSIAVARAMIDAGERVALLGGRDEIESIRRVADALGSGTVNLAERTSVREALAVMASLRAMVGGDTGLMHLAAGVGCPTVTVFGPTSQAKWGHHYPPHRVVCAPNGDMGQVRADDVLANLKGVLGPA